MADCNDPAELSDFASKDTSRIQGKIAESLAANSPYLNVLEGGTFDNGVSDEVRSVVQLQAAPGDSYVNPEFVDDTAICGTNGDETRTSTIEYSYKLQSKRGRGPRVCLSKGRAAFKGSYSMAEDALRKSVTQTVNGDIKYQLLTKSGTKFVAASGYSFDDLLTGGNAEDIGTGFAEILPTGKISFAGLHRVARYLREVLLADGFSGALGTHFKVIGGSDIIESFREESGVKDVMMSLVNGQYKLGNQVLTGYQWDSASVYRGLSFAMDQRPLRASGVDEDGQPIWVDWNLNVEDDAPKNKAHGSNNPAWLAAPYEALHLIARNSFARLTPEKYTGEGTFKFAPQLYAGELKWHYVEDNDCNQFGDYGWHKYQITRAYKPIRPEHVVTILYKRCDADLGLFDCENTGAEYTGSVI